MTYPTIVAEREGKIVGVLATTPHRYRIIAGPLAIDPGIKVKSFVALRLIEAYEVILRLSGVTQYYFNIRKDLDKDGRWGNMMEKLGITPFWEDKDVKAYCKEV
jgi:hypothetical protein